MKEKIVVAKFGGSILTDSNGFRHVAKLIKEAPTHFRAIVLSAVKGVTNALENIASAAIAGGKHNKNVVLADLIGQLEERHKKIWNELGLGAWKDSTLVIALRHLKTTVQEFSGSEINKHYILSHGERLSVALMNTYLKKIGIAVQYAHAPRIIKSAPSGAENIVSFGATLQEVKTLNTDLLLLTEGFIASDARKRTTTLGREGSDITAAVLALCYQNIEPKAECELYLFKANVPGILKFFNSDNPYKTTLIKEATYQEIFLYAQETGAKVVHERVFSMLDGTPITTKILWSQHPSIGGTVITTD